MTQSLYIVDGDDSYELVVEDNWLREIWLYRLNRPRKPEFYRYEWLDTTLQDRVDDLLLRHGHSHN